MGGGEYSGYNLLSFSLLFPFGEVQRLITTTNVSTIETDPVQFINSTTGFIFACVLNLFVAV